MLIVSSLIVISKLSDLTPGLASAQTWSRTVTYQTCMYFMHESWRRTNRIVHTGRFGQWAILMNSAQVIWAIVLVIGRSGTSIGTSLWVMLISREVLYVLKQVVSKTLVFEGKYCSGTVDWTERMNCGRRRSWCGKHRTPSLFDEAWFWAVIQGCNRSRWVKMRQELFGVLNMTRYPPYRETLAPVP